MVLMQLTIGVSLLLDVFGNCILAPMFANSAGKIPIGPEFSSPELLLHLRAPFEDLPCGKALNRGYYLGHGVDWDGLHEKMHVVLVRADLQEFHLVPVFYLYTYLFHYRIHILVEDGTPVLCGKNQMVYKYRDIMALMEVFAHLTTLRRKRRGIQPEVIQ